MAWGESMAPVPTVRPARSATDWTGESARTTTTEVRSRSVSRMATARTGVPAASPSRRDRTQAKGEFQATSTRPARRSST